MHRPFLAAAALVAAAAPALADNTSGTILAFDRVARIIILDDKTVWPLADTSKLEPEDLTAGDAVTIEFVSAGDSGLGRVVSVTRN